MHTLETCNKKPVVIAAIILFLLSTVAAGDIELTGMLRSYSGVRLDRRDIPITEQTVDISLHGNGSITKILINPYAFVGSEGEPVIGIREAYIDLFLPSVDLRIGKQAVVWGLAEGAFITDIVSPRDLRSFILADFREIRMGVPAFKAACYAGAFTFETVWIPRFVPSKLPDPDSVWYTTEMNSLSNADRPDDGLENSEFFGKIHYFGSALNAEIMAGYAWDDQPVRLSGTSFGHRRNTVAGGSLSTPLGPLVLRAEAAVYLNRSFTCIPPAPADKHHQLHGLAGVDWNLSGIDISVQYIAEYILDHDDAMAAQEFSGTATIRMRESFLSDTLHLQFFGYIGLDPLDALLRPSVTFYFEDSVHIEAGAELFFGEDNGTFGRYTGNTMGYLSLRWYF